MKSYKIVMWIPVPHYITDSGKVTGEWIEINASDVCDYSNYEKEKEAAIRYARELQLIHPSISVGVIEEEVNRKTLTDLEVFGDIAG